MSKYECFNQSSENSYYEKKKRYSSNDCRMSPAKISFSDLRRVETALCMVRRLQKWKRNKRFISLLGQKQLEREQKNLHVQKSLLPEELKTKKQKKDDLQQEYYQKQKMLKTNLRPKLKIRQLRRKNILKKQPHLQSKLIIFPWDC